MTIYSATALLFRLTSGGATLFVDERPIALDARAPSIVIGEGPFDEAIVFTDRRTGQTRDVVEVSFVELTYPGGGRGVYAGVFTADDLLYAIRAEGDPLPSLPGRAEDIDAFFARTGVRERDLGDAAASGYADGRTLRFADVPGLAPDDPAPPPPRDGSFASGDPGPDGLFDEQEIALLYEVALARRPDLPGLNFWIDEVYAEDGFSVLQIAEAFYFSDPFAQAIGADPETLSNADIVERLYANVLDRPGLVSQNDPAGYAFWLGAVESGLSRPALMREFAVSPENVANAAYVADLARGEDGGWVF